MLGGDELKIPNRWYRNAYRAVEAAKEQDLARVHVVPHTGGAGDGQVLAGAARDRGLEDRIAHPCGGPWAVTALVAVLVQCESRRWVH